MDFGFNEKDKAFQMEVRDFIQANMTPTIKFSLANDGLLNTPERREFISKMVPKGWLSMGFPEEYGGDGGSNPMAKYILNQELHRAGAPHVGKNLGTVVGCLMLYANEELKRDFIARTLANEIQWTICYSEPGAGSDLAAMRTSAVLDGDDYVINGEKRWITSAHFADYMWCAVRTGPDKHKGISIFVIDIKTPGITIHPIWMVYEEHRTNTVFFDNVRVPKSRLVGELNKGWRYMMDALNFERFMMISPVPTTRRMKELFDWVKAREVDGKPLIEDPVVRHKLAKLSMQVEMARMLDLRCIARAASNQDQAPKAEATMNKAMSALAGLEVADVAMEIMGPDAYIWEGEEAPIEGQMATYYFEAGHLRVAAAGLDVARNMIAKQHLNLPPSF